ncbi:MAG: DUF4810 domain-containing protein [Bacteroidales bacterium]|nr:DUF4810 domain-containing protein [Bacteroidales bacterium]
MKHNGHTNERLALRLGLLVFGFYFLFTSCSGQYKGIPSEEVLSYHTNATYGELYNLASAYADAINAAVKEDTLHPGLYADYGVTLALMGHREAACRMLNAEMKTFPESRGIVTRIKQQLMPELMGDDFAVIGDTANRVELARWAYDSLSALRPFPNVASIIDSTDTEWISKQTPTDSVEMPIRFTANQKREMLVAQQEEEARLKQAKIDSVAAAKQAKIDARKQAKVDKEKAKKQKAKAKKKAEKEKKKLEKQKQKERKQQAAEKEAQRKQQAAEKEAQRKQQAAEKEAQRKKQAEEAKQKKGEESNEK